MAFVKKKKRKKKENPFRTWKQLKRSKSLKSCPILVWESRSSVARSASIACFHIHCAQAWIWKRIECSSSSTDCPSSRPQCFHCSSNSLHASLLHQSCCVCLLSTGSSVPHKVNPALKQLCLRPRPLYLKTTHNVGILPLTSWLMCY